VVIGPDDQPVANTPVEIAGGLPATLSGEVIGESLPCSPNDPKCRHEAPPTTAPGIVQVKSPLDCAAQITKAREMNMQPPPAPGQAPSNISSNAASTGSGRGIMTDKAGRFALCVLPEVPAVNVNLPGGSKAAVKIAQNEPSLPKAPPDFFQPGQRISVNGLVNDPSAKQNGRQWRLPLVQAWSSNGQQVISVFKTPNQLQPGPAQISYRGGDRQTHEVQGTVFKIVRAFLDRTQLHSDQGATFEYEVLFRAQPGQNLCVKMRVAGPVVLVREPSPVIAIDANGAGKFGGKIRATQVAPGSTVPFDLSPDIEVCNAKQ
jgi:hypothetical protein